MRKSLTITVTLSQDFLRELNKMCKAADLNRSQLIRKVIRAYQSGISPDLPALKSPKTQG